MIKEFEQISKEREIPRSILQKIEDDISAGGTRAVSLTALQKEAINHENFWGKKENNKNLIIQGATSSGKTLVAELLTLQCVFSLNKHVIYLVPLKALVSEKVQQFKKDIFGFDSKLRINIFASSSDYQDHDTELSEGQYDIAVVVYEKFFAMLAEQKDNKFLEKCGLIVVDELQLLGSQDRGAKLEYSLTKVRNNYKNSIRIVGMTTIDCDMGYVGNWLEADIIKNAQRPIGLRERIVSLNGLYWEREIEADSNLDMEIECDHREDVIEIEELEKLKNQKRDVKKNALLHALLKQVTEEDNEKKIIVFANSRGRCKEIARSIAKSKVFSHQDISEELLQELDKTDDESERNVLKNELLPYGIAYHSAVLPLSLRELIEAEYKKNGGGIKLLVATETITIGMNLPADVMILYDDEVNRGSEGRVCIKPQEYKNYIGRAGRLGITDKIGESYLFVDSDSEIPPAWKEYVHCNIEAVSSALIDSTPLERASAPYYLNLLCKGKEEQFSHKTLEELTKKTLIASEMDCGGKVRSTNVSKMIDFFSKVDLIHESASYRDELEGEVEEEVYKLTKFGEMLAPYALSLDTCLSIRKHFRDEGNKSAYGGLPIDYSSDDLRKKKYLLDILFTICKMKEVSKISHPRLPEPKNPNSRKLHMIIENAIVDYLERYRQEKGEDAFWENSEINENFFGQDSIDDFQLNAVLRAILLYHWIDGDLLSVIKARIGLNIKEFEVNTGDLSRVGESCAYICEAISKCLFTNRLRKDSFALEHAFYSLAIKLKYGLSNPNLIQVANRHIYGLSRSTIIKMDRAAREFGFENINLFIRSSNSEVLRYLTITQKRELLQQMSERYDDKNAEKLIAKLVEDDIVDLSVEADYKGIAYPRDCSDWLASLERVLSSLGIVHFPIRVKDIMYDGVRIQWFDKRLYVLLLFDKTEMTTERTQDYRMKLGLNPEDKILYLHNRDIEFESEDEYESIVSAEYFTKIVLEFMALCGYADGTKICEYLYGFSGEISDKGTSSLQSSIEEVIQDSTMEGTTYDDIEADSYERFLKEHGYSELEILESDGTCHALLHEVIDKHGVIRMVKEIKIPESREEFEVLEEKTERLYREFGEYIEDEKARDIIKNLFKYRSLGVHVEHYVEIILDKAHKRKKQLHKDVENEAYYFYQSLVFLTEGYKRLNEVTIAGSFHNSHIVEIHLADIYQEDYEHPSLRDVDTKFNLLHSRVFMTMNRFLGNVSMKKDQLCYNKKGIVDLGIQICDALIACHKAGILHRDIKPENILFNDNEEYFLCDFGCAVKKEDSKTVNTYGTRGYMAPELEYTEQSDVYSLGMTLKYLYTGKITDWDFEDDKVGKELLEVLKKACVEKRSERYESAKQFKEALQNI